MSFKKGKKASCLLIAAVMALSLSFFNSGIRALADSAAAATVLAPSDKLARLNHSAPFMQTYADGGFQPDKTVTIGNFINVWDNIGDAGSDIWPELNVLTAAGELPSAGDPDADRAALLTMPLSRGVLVHILDQYADQNINGDDYIVFSDVTESDAISYALGQEAAMGWIVGYPDGSFRPDNPVTRAELASVICRLLDKTPDLTDTPSFTDIQPDFWAYKDIAAATQDSPFAALTAKGYSADWTPANEVSADAASWLNFDAAFMTAYSDNSFNPDQAVTTGEFAETMRILYGDETDGAANLLAICVASGILPNDGDEVNPDTPMTRGSLVQFFAMWADTADWADTLDLPQAVFNDVPPADPLYSDLNAEYAMGWVNVRPDGSFKPDDPVTRAELAVSLCRFSDKTPDMSKLTDEPIFTDIYQDYWAYSCIAAATQERK